MAGERRWRAAQQAGFSTIPAIVRDTADDVLLRDALLENLHRAQLNPLEEAAAYGQLLNDFGCTQERARRPDRAIPAPGVEHPPAAAAADRSPAARRRRRPLAPATPERCWRWSPPRTRNGWPGASWPRGCRSAPSRSSSRWAMSVRTNHHENGQKPRRVPRWPTLLPRSPTSWRPASPSTWAVRKGKITITFASVDDLERIVEVIAPQASRSLRGAP